MPDVTKASANDITIRRAIRDDVPAIVCLFADDAVGGHGDSDDPRALPHYFAAFDAIEASGNQTLFVVASDSGRIVGTFETTLLRGMAGRGAASVRIGGVQVAADARGRGIGEAMMRFALDEARRLGAAGVQLTSNMARADAHRFYARLGFAHSHAGFTLKL